MVRSGKLGAPFISAAWCNTNGSTCMGTLGCCKRGGSSACSKMAFDCSALGFADKYQVIFSEAQEKVVKGFSSLLVGKEGTLYMCECEGMKPTTSSSKCRT